MKKTYIKGKSEILSQNFESSEFDCKCKGCCSKTVIDTELVKLLQKVRAHFGKAVKINSGYRCNKHNESVDGSRTSQHLSGCAADIVVSDVSTEEVAKYLESIGAKGIIRYVTKRFVHVDTRKTKYYAEVKSGKTEVIATFGAKACPYKKPTVNIKLGSRGEGVKYVQYHLTKKGYSLGSIDGICGLKTVNAIKKFQKANSLTVDGIAGKKTLALL